MNRSISGSHNNRRPAAVHLSINPRRAERAFDGHRNIQADMPVLRAGIDIRLHLPRYLQIYAAIPGMNIPCGRHR